MGGATGLDYTAVLSVIDRAHKSRKRRDALFADVQVMETAALKEMAKK